MRCRMLAAILAALATLTLCATTTTPASAAPAAAASSGHHYPPRPIHRPNPVPSGTWHNCSREPTSKQIGALVDHNDHFAGAPGPSCITASDNGHRITIDRNYQPGKGVVAYDAIEFGRYPYSNDPQYGLPAPVAQVRTTLHVRASSGPGYYLYDADIWLSRTGATGPLHHVREMIVANWWHGFAPYDAPHLVKVGHRRWYVGAKMTRGGGRHLLIRFFTAHPTRRAYDNVPALLRIARRHGWISNRMTVDSIGYAPECWRGCKGLTYLAFPAKH